MWDRIFERRLEEIEDKIGSCWYDAPSWVTNSNAWKLAIREVASISGDKLPKRPRPRGPRAIYE